MSAQRRQRLLQEALGDRDDLPGVGGVLACAGVLGTVLIALLFMG